MYLWRFNTSFYYFPVDLFTPRNNKRMWKNKLCEISLSLFSVNVTYILPHWREIHYFLSSIIFIRKWFYLWLKQWEKSHYCTFQEHADSKIKRPTDKFVLRYRQSNFRGSSQLTTSVEHCCRCVVVVWDLHNDLINALSAVVGSWEDPVNIWLTVAKTHLVFELSILKCVCYWNAQ